MNYLLYSIMTLILAFFFIAAGIVMLIIPWFSSIQVMLVHFLLENSLVLSAFGASFLLIGIGLLANIYLNSKRKYYHIRSDKCLISINEVAIQQYLQHYWLKQFPNLDIPCRLKVKNDRIHIQVDFPHIPNAQQPIFLETIKKDLGRAFKDLLDYPFEFYLSASFQKDGNTSPSILDKTEKIPYIK